MLPARGRPGATLVLTVERQLTAEDLFRAATEPGVKVAAPTIQRLRSIHHRIAQDIAKGTSVTDTARAAGYTPQRVGDLTRDPAFQNLVMYYQEQFVETVISAQQAANEVLVDIAEMSAHEVQARLEDPAKRAEIPTGELRQLMALATTVQWLRRKPPCQVATPQSQ